MVFRPMADKGAPSPRLRQKVLPRGLVKQGFGQQPLQPRIPFVAQTVHRTLD
jgi:hypothetical protein